MRYVKEGASGLGGGVLPFSSAMGNQGNVLGKRQDPTPAPYNKWPPERLLHWLPNLAGQRTRIMKAGCWTLTRMLDFFERDAPEITFGSPGIRRRTDSAWHYPHRPCSAVRDHYCVPATFAFSRPFLEAHPLLSARSPNSAGAGLVGLLLQPNFTQVFQRSGMQQSRLRHG